MDILAEVKRQLNDIPFMEERQRFEAVLEHLRMAIAHYRHGLQSKNEQYFVDTILRSNQVFEGCLKEAYRIIKSENPQHLSLEKIEKFFQQEGILGERLASLVTLYRQTWRNKSTHDYYLSYTSGDALMAIMLTSAFLGILFEGMVRELTKQYIEQQIKSTIESTTTPLIQIIDLVITRSLNESLSLNAEAQHLSPRYESQILEGIVLALLQQAGLQITREASIKGNEPNSHVRHTRVDLLITREPEIAIVDIKLLRGTIKGIEDRVNYLQGLQSSYHISNAVLIAFDPSSKQVEYDSHIFNNIPGRRDLKILVIAPQKILREFISKQ